MPCCDDANARLGWRTVLRRWARGAAVVAAPCLVLCLAPSPALAEPVLDQESVSVGDPGFAVGFSNTLTRAQTFTVGVEGTLAQVELKVSGAATATFEIHPTTNGLPVLGSQPLGAAEVVFDTPSLDPPIHVVADFTPAAIEVEIGDVLAIVMQPGAFTVSPTNTPFWHGLNRDYRYEAGSYHSTTGLSPNDFVDFVPGDVGFRTWVEPTPVAGGPPFDADDRSDRRVALYAETTPCLTTGTNGLADPSCTTYAGGAGPALEPSPLLAELSWAGDVATLTLAPASVETWLLSLGVVAPVATTPLTLRYDVVTGDIVGGTLAGGAGDWFFRADLPTPQGTLSFDWLNRSQVDRPFEGTVLVGTAFEKQVVATCASEADAPAPVVEGGVCFLQQDPSPGFDPLSSTLTAYAHRDAVFPIEDYSPEFDTLDFAIAELPAGISVPALGRGSVAVLALLLAFSGAVIGRSGRKNGRRSSRIGLLVLCGIGFASPEASAARFEGTLELSVAENFGDAGAAPVWHRVLRTPDGRHPLPSSTSMPPYAHGQRVEVEGELVDGVLHASSISVSSSLDTVASDGSQEARPRLAVAGLAAVSRTPAVPASETLGAQSTLVTLLNFTNDTSQPYTTAEVTDWLLDETEPTSTASFIREVSYGRAWLVGGVVGWLSVGYDDTDCELWTPDGVLDLVFAMDPLINFATVDRWIIVIPPERELRLRRAQHVGQGSAHHWRWRRRVLAHHPQRPRRFELGRSRARAWAQHRRPAALRGLRMRARHGGRGVCARRNGRGRVRCDGVLRGLWALLGAEQRRAPLAGLGRRGRDWCRRQLLHRALREFVAGHQGPSRSRALANRRAAAGECLLPQLPHRPRLRFGLSRARDGRRADPPRRGLLPGGRSSGHGRIAATRHDSGLCTRSGSRLCGQLARRGADLFGCDARSLDRGRRYERWRPRSRGPAFAVLRERQRRPEPRRGVRRSRSTGRDLCVPGLHERLSRLRVQLRIRRVWLQRPPLWTGAPVRRVLDECLAELPLDPAVRALWRNAETWTEVRNQIYAKDALDHYASFRLLNHQTFDRSWIYRTTLPFDTSSLPDSAPLVSASLQLRVLTGLYLFENSHPASADQLVLVEPSLANPPVAELIDFSTFASLDDPTEGAPRIDIGDVQDASDFDIQFDLNPTGLGWIDPTGTTIFGLRGGYDVDDVTVPGEEPVLLLTFRSEASPTTGPKLSVRYQPVPEPGLAPGLLAGIVLLMQLRRARPSR